MTVERKIETLAEGHARIARLELQLAAALRLLERHAVGSVLDTLGVKIRLHEDTVEFVQRHRSAQ